VCVPLPYGLASSSGRGSRAARPGEARHLFGRAFCLRCPTAEKSAPFPTPAPRSAASAPAPNPCPILF
jgi:hypothetical protein